MPVLGTAGHVDHGKTTLIKALTGIDADRLPEEKERGLTIDLGFAHFRSPSGGTIGVVDVPGHERFIRNMVAGAWGLDGALLVAAADDGWMYQSENHLKVLSAMGVNAVILVITKIDLVSREQAEQVKKSALDAAGGLIGRRLPAAAVSAESGEGLEELKNIIFSLLEGRAASPDGAVRLWVDRSFTVPGAGTVVTGTLRGGGLEKSSPLRLHPGNKPVRLRGIQIYGEESTRALAPCRTALNLGNVPVESVGRGCCLVEPDSDFSSAGEVLLRIEDGWKDTGQTPLKNHSRLEFALGTAHAEGTIHFIRDGEGGETSCARVVLGRPLPCRFGQPVVIIRKGGSRILGAGRILRQGPTTREERRILAGSAGLISRNFSREDQRLLTLMIRGFLPRETGHVPGEEARKPIRILGDWILHEPFLLKRRKEIQKLIASPGGMSGEELAGKLEIPRGLIEAIIKEGMGEDGITEKNGRFLQKTGGNNLSPRATDLLRRIEDAGKAGWDPVREKIPGARQELRILGRENLIIPLTDTLFYSRGVYDEVAAVILDGMSKGDRFTIALTKERTGLSRKYIIPLLNRMEEEKRVKREDNERIVL